MNDVNHIPQKGQRPPLLSQLIADVIFLRQRSGFGGERYIPLDSPEGRLVAAYLGANRDIIQIALAWFYENTTEAEREDLNEQNPMADPGIIPAEFQKTALHVIGEVTEPWGLVGGRITVDSIRMLLRGLQAIEAHGRFDDASGASRLYQLLISPVEEIWPAWQKAYGTGLPPTE